MELPPVLQGGMGIAVSGWLLASAVARAGQIGIVSGAGLSFVLARRLQMGDAGGHYRRALDHFPAPAIAHKIVQRYYIEGGKLESLYSTGAVANIEDFHRFIAEGNCANTTVAPSVRSNLTSILGRTAAYEQRIVTLEEILKANVRIEPNLKGLKA